MLLPETEIELLVRAAQWGDATSLTALFQAHYAGMRSVANQILGAGPDAEDACQDSAIAALATIRELRDPAAVRAWLHTIVRNTCRSKLRVRRPIPLDVVAADLTADDRDAPHAGVDRDAERDWIRHAIGRLSPAARPVAMLRYFLACNSYQRIAALCGIPVGTVRSRLSEGRRQLATVLPQVRDERHADFAALTAARWQEADAVLAATPAGALPRAVRGRWAWDTDVWWPDGRRTAGLASVLDTLRHDRAAGLRHRPVEVIAGPGITVWETATRTWVLHEREGQVREVRLAD
ncbi:RNA polymerase sigma factor [Actinoplanes sp. L3-i22]|uniref:RNA polymerase sigma factor n=1 Tax=Actinoplanes sp. L3-i22 TaxID=2836373 RepID=UPI001C840E62|nr:sigma-70 family RNA polymerase sigma factor [Actinoplanes sp. L3-i22]